MEHFDTQRVTQWFTRPLTDLERAQRSERWFWARVLTILACAVTVGSLGVLQVRRSSAGIRTAYALVKTNDALREQIEANRHAEARLTGMKNPNELRKEALDTYEMHAPTADEQVEVD